MNPASGGVMEPNAELPVQKRKRAPNPALAKPPKPKNKKPKAKRGRPSSYSEKIADDLCDHMASGKSLLSFCEQPGSPDRRTVGRWLEKRSDFRIRFARAREDQVEAFVDGLLEICDDPTLDPNDKRIRVDTRKWIAARILPKKYGDRVATELTGRDGGPIEIESNSSDLEAARRVAFMLARALGKQEQQPQIEAADQPQIIDPL